MNKINILLAADKNYLQYLDIVLKSLFVHHTDLNIFILHTGDIELKWLEERQVFFRNRCSDVFSVYLNENDLMVFEENGYISKATYLRYFIEDIFEYSQSPYWIYLDCDVVVNRNITKPFLDYPNEKLLAVSDPYINKITGHKFRNQDYFNAGVLYINANYWKDSKKTLIDLTEALKSELIFGDQDVLNFYIKDHWIKLDRSYNFQRENLMNFDEVNESKPHIIHFTGPDKPLDSKTFIRLRDIVALFHIYNDMKWEHLNDLPLGFLSLTLNKNN